MTKKIDNLFESIFNVDEYSEEELNEAIDIIKNLSDKMDSITRKYTYVAPDYSKRIGELPVALHKLEVSDEVDDLDEGDYEELCKELAFLDREELVSGLDSLIYAWLAEYIKIENYEESENSTATTPLHWAVRLVEKFGVRECIPTLLEVMRQNLEILDYLFTYENMYNLIPSCIYQIMTVDDVPMLMEFVNEKDITSIANLQIMHVVATLPRRKPETLGMVQKWLTELLEYFEKNLDKTILDDNIMVETAINCCIHTRNVDAKNTIIRLYSKFILSDTMVSGGVNEVRKSIKNAEIGVIDPDRDSAEKIYQLALEYDEEDWDDEDWDDDDEDELINRTYHK